MISGDPAERDAYLELVAAFEEAQPIVEEAVMRIGIFFWASAGR